MSTVIAKLVAEAIQARDAALGRPYNLGGHDAEELARAAIDAYGDALAAAGLAIVPLKAAEAVQAQDRRSVERGGQDARERVKARLGVYRSLGGRKA
ncbi:hypothetical protein OPKNFCMD_4744 [Methylobacterium crusticola]|uniref:Uncharacterized protein n=1 Tax=Methylobacterium crusticola TaxID=1697972 RepID=A0ABQ4R4A9_9HYPH|nr:hypothetical protein [Methylobacterium crusticola]GJD51984.1 hypothetical protein OPKNFCMD_4744 [Methylobacterium crusticola]